MGKKKAFRKMSKEIYGDQNGKASADVQLATRVVLRDDLVAYLKHETNYMLFGITGMIKGKGSETDIERIADEVLALVTKARGAAGRAMQTNSHDGNIGAAAGNTQSEFRPG